MKLKNKVLGKEDASLLWQEIQGCSICASALSAGVRPVVTMDARSKILIVGQAPGRKVHASGIPWDDQSGQELRSWLGVSKEEFYDPANFSIVPMGFCYPGKGKQGDLPPRRECAPLWHSRVLDVLEGVELILLIGAYAQSYYLKKNKKDSLTETVRNFQSYQPMYFPLPHPSPRNFIWKAKNAWFKAEVLPFLQTQVRRLLHPNEM